MLSLLLGIEILAAAYWLKSSLDESQRQIDSRLESMEVKLRVIEQKINPTGEGK
jgi:hypothetical protein